MHLHLLYFTCTSLVNDNIHHSGSSSDCLINSKALQARGMTYRSIRELGKALRLFSEGERVYNHLTSYTSNLLAGQPGSANRYFVFKVTCVYKFCHTRMIWKAHLCNSLNSHSKISHRCTATCSTPWFPNNVVRPRVRAEKIRC